MDSTHMTSTIVAGSLACIFSGPSDNVIVTMRIMLPAIRLYLVTQLFNVVMNLLGLEFVVGVRALQEGGNWTLVLESAGISSMHTAISHYDTAIFLDRTNIGPSQINFTDGFCRNNPHELALKHDCSAHSVMFDPGSGTLRPLKVLTDTWCSSGQFFPNGSMVQTGGEFDGLRKVRLLDACGTWEDCDWVEWDKGMDLTDGRWYATNQLLPDGRQIVVGGINSFTYEFVPKKYAGEGSFSLEFLKDTDDAQGDNMYPFVHLLPCGNLFIFANRDSILLDYKHNVVLRKYPKIPGEPRNYPSAGSSVMLPLDHADDFMVAEVLVCGGARYGAFRKPDGKKMAASQTCGRIVATAFENPHWRMETMPMTRAMGDMIILPTGDVLLINGAHNGSQGWEKASDPVFTPVTYATDNAKSRFQVLRPSPIARLYHSTANLLSDGRILVAGSNTHKYYTFKGEFPTELRVEAFNPPYLDTDYDDIRPSIYRISTRAIIHNSTFQVVFTVHNRTGSFDLNLLSSPFTTHSFGQGQRMVKLKVTDPVPAITAGTFSAIATAPPSSVVAPASFYLLWPVQAGVPGKALWVQISSTSYTISA